MGARWHTDSMVAAILAVVLGFALLITGGLGNNGVDAAGAGERILVCDAASPDGRICGRGVDRGARMDRVRAATVTEACGNSMRGGYRPEEPSVRYRRAPSVQHCTHCWRRSYSLEWRDFALVASPSWIQAIADHSGLWAGPHYDRPRSCCRHSSRFRSRWARHPGIVCWG